MLTISKKGDYGLLFMTYLAKAPDSQFIPLSQIAADYRLPYKFLSQIAIELKKAQLVKSKEGMGGGYQLAKASAKITTADILGVLQSLPNRNVCFHGKNCPYTKVCLHAHVMVKLSQSINHLLRGYTLKDLVN